MYSPSWNVDLSWMTVVIMIYYFLWPAFILPLIVGAWVLIKYRMDPLCRAAALLVLKPIVATPLWAIIFIFVGSTPGDFAGYSLTILPGICLALIILLTFRHLFRTNTKPFMLLLALDATRWFYTFFLFFPWTATSTVNMANRVSLTDAWYLIGITLPNFYVVVVWVLMRYRARRSGEVRLEPIEHLPDDQKTKVIN